MIEKFDGGMIDITSVIQIVNKLNFYLQNEELIINNIKNSLFALDSYYSNDFTNKILDVKNNLYDMFNIMQRNRGKYLEHIENVVNGYIEQNDKTISAFKNDIG